MYKHRVESDCVALTRKSREKSYGLSNELLDLKPFFSGFINYLRNTCTRARAIKKRKKLTCIRHNYISLLSCIDIYIHIYIYFLHVHGVNMQVSETSSSFNMCIMIVTGSISAGPVKHM